MTELKPSKGILVFGLISICASIVSGILLQADSGGLNDTGDELSSESEDIAIVEFLRLAIRAEQKHDFAECRQYYHRAIALAGERSQWDSSSIAYSLLANGSFRIKRNESLAYRYLDSARILAGQVSDDPRLALAYSYWVYGEIHNYYKRHDSALAYYHRCIDSASAVNPVLVLLSNCYYSMSTLYGQQGDVAAYCRVLEKSLSLGLILFGENSERVAKCYHRLATAYMTVRHYDKAQRYFERALAIKRDVIGARHPTTAWTSAGLASLLHVRGAYAEEIALLDRAIADLVASLGEYHFMIAECQTQLAEACYELGAYDRAKESVRKAQTIYTFVRDNNGAEEPGIEFKILKTLARCHSKTGHFEQARRCLSASQALATQFKLGAVDLVDLMCSWGEFFREWDKPDSSLQYYQQALSICVPDFQDDNISANPDLRTAVGDAFLLYALVGKFKSLAAKGSGSVADVAALDLALETFYLVVHLIARLEREQLDEDWKYTWMSKFRPQFDLAMHIANRLYQSSKEARYLNYALYFSERSKSVIYRRQFNKTQAKLSNPVLDSLLQVESSLKLELAALRHGLGSDGFRADDKSDSARTRTRELIFAKWAELDEFNQLISQKFPLYRVFDNDDWLNDSLSQLALPSDSCTIIDYYRGSNFIQVIAISSSASSMQHVPIDSTFGQLIANLRDAIVRKHYLDFVEPAYSLYKLLLEPALVNDAFQNLTIIPDADIGLIPFDCLISEAANPTVPDYRKLRYLMRDFCIQYDFSVSHLRDSTRRQRQFRAGKGGYVGFAPTFAGSEL